MVQYLTTVVIKVIKVIKVFTNRGPLAEKLKWYGIYLQQLNTVPHKFFRKRSSVCEDLYHFWTITETFMSSQEK